ncbi:hypothetical protein [Symbioplanes lichenis]|uniref:hypothetical protein n=1 Tax=Symbioplanes lichenis TaxID=1629072 RepID=UPI002739B0AB|nr:hypothetical protein [Actinoplanes lichenis]
MKLAALPVAALAAVALAACTDSAATPVTAPPAPSAPVASAATTAPADDATPTSGATAESAGDTTTEPAAEAPSVKKADWAKPLFEALGCKKNDDVPSFAEIQLLKAITVGGESQVVTASSCPTTTSTNPVFVRVHAGGPESELLLNTGKGLSLREVSVAVKGSTLTVNATALSDEAPLCCADLRVSETYEWDGSAYTKTGSSKKPL